MRILKLVSIFGFLFVISNAQTSDALAKVGTAGAQFLKYPVGARGAALGNSLIVKVQDASAVFWNPAGLASITGASGFYTHSSLFLGMTFDGASFVHTIPRWGNFGVNFIYFSSGDIEETTIEQQTGTGENFQFTDLAVGFSYAKALSNRFSIGGNLRYIQEDMAKGLTSESDLVAKAWSTDLGILYFTDFMGLSLGMKISNFGPQLQPGGSYFDWDNGTPVMNPSSPTDTLDIVYKKYHMPLNFCIGIGFDPIKTDAHQVTIFSALEHPNDNIELINLAGEYTFKTPMAQLSLRGGYSFGHDVSGLTLGFGINYQSIQLDYAMVDYRLLDYVRTFSITFSR